MSPDSAPRGADPVNDEFEVGYDEGFERTWRRAELTGHAVMLLFVIAALLGLFGQGPLSHRSARTPNGMLIADYEPIARHDTSTQLTFHLSTNDDPLAPHSPNAMHRVQLFVSSTIIEPLGLQYILPRPVDTEAVGGGIVYSFNIPPGRNTGLVRFVLKPSIVGRVRIDAHAGDDALSFT
jgi:hypothetical protein